MNPFFKKDNADPRDDEDLEVGQDRTETGSHVIDADMVKGEIKGKKEAAHQSQGKMLSPVPLEFMIRKSRRQQDQTPEKDAVKGRYNWRYMTRFDPYAGETDHDGPDEKTGQGVAMAEFFQ